MDETAERILAATVEEAAAVGLQRVTMDGVARRAGVNRMTVYRHFKDRDGLVAAMAARDTERGIAVLTEAMAGHDDPVDALVEAFVAILGFARAHPFITRAARHEPGWLIEAGMSDGAAMLRQAVALGGAAIRQLYDGPTNPEQLAETLARLVASYVLLPVTVSVDVDDEENARAYARMLLEPLLAPTDSRKRRALR